jgi:hypothetical protein
MIGRFICIEKSITEAAHEEIDTLVLVHWY